MAFSQAVDPRLWLMGLDAPETAFGPRGEEYRIFSTVLVVALVAGILLGGLVGDLLGRRRVMLLSLLVSIAFGLIAWLGGPATWAAVARLVAAGTGAMALPLALGVIRLTFVERERPLAMFAYTVVTEAAVLVALLALAEVGGALGTLVLPTAVGIAGLYLAWRATSRRGAAARIFGGTPPRVPPGR
ncbi:MAG: MFS transporter [Chloroflexi bacterium]|nr:MFS transporter [Chloroflexota bacterium]